MKIIFLYNTYFNKIHIQNNIIQNFISIKGLPIVIPTIKTIFD